MSDTFTDITPRYVAARLAQRIDDSVRWLLPNGQRVRDDWCVGSIDGEPGNSLKVCMEGEKVGRWRDFASEQYSGDLLDLAVHTQKWDVGKAMKEACEFLGIEKPKWGARKQKQLYVEPPRPADARTIDKAPAVQAWLSARKIRPETYARFKIFADGSGTVVYPYMRDGKVFHMKYRAISPKRFWSSAGTERGLFGWQALQPDCRAVCITEGEQDTMALADYGLQALSIPVGAGKGEKQDWIENEWDNLERFDTIYIAIDMDGPGIKTVQELAERLGRHRCKLVRLPRKDANACLMEGVPKADILKAISQAKSIDPVELRNSYDFLQQVTERFHPSSNDVNGFHFPWHSIADAFLAEWGAVTVVAGYSGHGKSEICGQVMLDAIRQKHTCCVASMEFKTSKWLARLVRQSLGTETPAVEDIDAAMSWMGDKLWAVDMYGSAKADRVLEIFEYANRRYGVRVFLIDNFTKLGIPDDDLTEQKRVMNAITELAVRLDVHIILVHHLRKEESDYSATNMSKLSLKGSSSIGDLVDNIWLIWRNRKKEKDLKDAAFAQKSPEEQEEIRRKPDTVLACEKMREGDDEPRLALWFDRKSHTWQDSRGAPVYHYVKIKQTEAA